MRWTTPLMTVFSLAVLAGIAWQAEGLQNTDALPQETNNIAKQRSAVTTLAEMDAQEIRRRLDWSVGDVETTRPAFSTYATSAAVAYLGSDQVTQEQAAAAVAEFQQKLAAADSPIAGQGYIDHAPQHVGLRGGAVAGSRSAYNPNSNVNDFKYVPRMQRFGLTRLYRFGNVDTIGGRDMFDRTRFGQQQRELDRLRARRDSSLYRQNSRR